MTQLLIAIIYLAFISLGLPDSLLGSGWPAMHVELHAALSSAGIISMLISLSTILSALLSDRLTRKLGAGGVTAISVILTAGAMMGFSFAGSFWQLCLLAAPYGVGAGAIDACLNNYVALHLSSRHMSWLHCCWGVGAMISPYIMGGCLTGAWGWRGGYRTVSLIQLVLAGVMLAALPLWKRKTDAAAETTGDADTVRLTIPQILRLPGVLLMLFGFFGYCAVETLPIVWASSYFRGVYALPERQAAFFASLFYIGMTAGRAMMGFFANKIPDRLQIRWGMTVVLCSMLFLLIPSGSYIPSLIGFALMGLGCAPVYPSFVHSTPENFGRRYSQSIIGVQMAFAYLGMTFTPLLFGKLAEATDIRALPFCILALSVLILILTERMRRTLAKSAPAQ